MNITSQTRPADVGRHTFRLSLDDDEEAAVRRCVACMAEHPIGDSSEYLKDAELEECACPCGSEEFEITVLER